MKFDSIAEYEAWKKEQAKPAPKKPAAKKAPAKPAKIEQD